MRDWAACTIATTARPEIRRFHWLTPRGTSVGSSVINKEQLAATQHLRPPTQPISGRDTLFRATFELHFEFWRATGSGGTSLQPVGATTRHSRGRSTVDRGQRSNWCLPALLRSPGSTAIGRFSYARRSHRLRPEMAGSFHPLLHPGGAKARRVQHRLFFSQTEYCDNLIFRRRAAVDASSNDSGTLIALLVNLRN
jgi:hypothetical protein